MFERRAGKRADSADRRDIFRPALWFNLLLLGGGIVASLFAGWQRQRIDAEFTRAFNKSFAGPSELNQITAELAEMDLAKGTLEKELERRVAYIGGLKALDFYLSIDTAKKTLALKSGNEVVRTTDIEIGAAAAKGSFAVAGKKLGAPGRYSIFLPNDRVISSLKSPKPGSFTVPAEDLKAIWDRITPETRVYVF